MEDIKMVDQKAQYAHLKAELDAAFSAVMEQMEFKNGPQESSFARKLEEYLQVRHATTCANGADALQIALMALGLPSGTEVVMPAFNDASGAEVVQSLGLKPVFVDVQPNTFTLDPAAVEEVITPATVAILPTHLFGQCADMQPLLNLAQQHRLWVVEDNTQSLGAIYTAPDRQGKKAGSIGPIGVTSFFPAKPLGGGGDGGAVLTNDSELGQKIQEIAKKGMPEMHLFGSGSVHSQLDTLQAAMLEVKTKYIDAYNAARQKVAQFYDNAFANSALVQVPFRAPYSTHIFHQYTITIAPALRDGLREHLRSQHIPSVVYYPQPLHLQDSFRHLHYKPNDFPVSEQLSHSVLSLPMHSELKEDQLEYICFHVLDFLKKNT
jgi:dTDP-4-amino-4,6-dideoxygalactose transaminase